MHADDPVLVARHGAVAVLTLNRPQAMNALSRALCAALADALIALEEDAGVRALVLTGAGERAYCAGVDLKELESQPRALEAIAGDPARDPARLLAGMSKPVIGAINGLAITGGFELALACDVLVASNRAAFADTHAKVGLLPAWGLSQILPRLIGPYRARDVSFSGRFIDADTALAWGLVSRVFAPDRLQAEALALAQDIASRDGAVVAGYKKLIADGMALDLGQAREMERRVARAYNSGVGAEAIAARREAVQQGNRAARP